MERQLVLDVEIDIDRAGCGARAQRRRHLAIRQLIERDDVLGDFVEVRQLAFGDGGRLVLDLVEIEIARSLDPQASDFRLGDLEDHDAVLRILLRDRDRDGLIALGLVGLLQGSPGFFDILGGPLGAKKRINCLLHFDLRHVIGAFDPIFVDVEADHRLVLVRALILGSRLILGWSGLALGLSRGLLLRLRAGMLFGLGGRFLCRIGSCGISSCGIGRRQCGQADQCKGTD
jgi:hypothetical protein